MHSFLRSHASILANLDSSGSDRNRPKDYRRAVVIDTGPKNTTNEDAFQGERRSTFKKPLTEPTLLEMSGYRVNRDLACEGDRYSRWQAETIQRDLESLPSFERSRSSID
jgi:hypothetical protein